jgi:polar amino acid transport system substrate-binding protein
LGTRVGAATDNVVRIGTDEWCPYACAQTGRPASGFLVDLTVEAFALEGYRAELVLQPLERAVRNVPAGELDGTFLPPNDDRFSLSQPLSHSRACFYVRANDNWSYQGLASLSEVTIGVDDNNYDLGEMDAYLSQHQHNGQQFEISTGDNADVVNLRKLLAGRYRVMLQHEAVAIYLASRAGAATAIKSAGCLARQMPMAIGFSRHNPRSAEWIGALARGMKTMQGNGRLIALRRQYGVPE